MIRKIKVNNIIPKYILFSAFQLSLVFQQINENLGQTKDLVLAVANFSWVIFGKET